MVQRFLNSRWTKALRSAVLVAGVCLLALSAMGASKKRVQAPIPDPPADLALQGGRRLAYERSFSSEKDSRKKPGFFTKLVNVIIGAPDMHLMVRPYSIAVDSRGRAIVTDPGAGGVHIFDFAEKKYKFIERLEKGRDPMLAPQCVALDAQDNIYVTDSESGKVFVFNRDGKYRRAIGSLKGGEGFFKRPTGIAVDSAAQRIYVTDTLRNKIFQLDFAGNVLKTIGKPGLGNGEFNFPTELRLRGDDLAVVDAMNFRVQLLRRDGTFESIIGHGGDDSGAMFRPKGVAVDSEHHYYVVDGLWGVVQVFDEQGQLLYYFGKNGTAPGDFQLPAGVFIDPDDRIFVVDSLNRRVQVFRYFGLKNQAAGGAQ